MICNFTISIPTLSFSSAFKGCQRKVSLLCAFQSQRAICIKKKGKSIASASSDMHYCSYRIAVKMLKPFLCMNALSKPTGFRWILNHSMCSTLHFLSQTTPIQSWHDESVCTSAKPSLSPLHLSPIPVPTSTSSLHLSVPDSFDLGCNCGCRSVAGCGEERLLCSTECRGWDGREQCPGDSTLL